MRRASKNLLFSLGWLVGLLASRQLGASEPDGPNASFTRIPFRIPKVNDVRLQRFKADPPEVALGERLFLETRFAQFFFAHSRGDVNAVLTQGDPVLASAPTTSNQSLPGPFADLSMNCRACHLVSEEARYGRGRRSYADFARRSQVPIRQDGKRFTTRNSPQIVNALVARPGDLFLHDDGEFISGTDLVKATFTGRNFGWLATEHSPAVRHIANVIRGDNGRGALAREFGGYSYAKVFAGNSSEIEEDYLIPEELRIDVGRANGDEILDVVARVVQAYMRSLRYSKDERMQYDASPYDVFLEKNQLDRKPASGQSDRYYTRHMLTMLADLKEPRFVTPADKCFKTFKQPFRFGALELAGMKIFFTRSTTNSGETANRQSVGNCVACHTPPDFTDFRFHNTGVSQVEYDSVHGDAAFARLFIPELPQRETNYDAWLPPTPSHPSATGNFAEVPSAEFPLRADLGLWNVFANPDQPAAQPALLGLFTGGRRVDPLETILSQTIALFKTPTLRGLAHSNPYLHNGASDSLEDVVHFYIKTSALARAGRLRNAAPELSEMRLRDEDVEPLAAFLRALNEDYE